MNEFLERSPDQPVFFPIFVATSISTRDTRANRYENILQSPTFLLWACYKSRIHISILYRYIEHFRHRKKTNKTLSRNFVCRFCSSQLRSAVVSFFLFFRFIRPLLFSFSSKNVNAFSMEWALYPSGFGFLAFRPRSDIFAAPPLWPLPPLLPSPPLPPRLPRALFPSEKKPQQLMERFDDEFHRQ